MYLTKQTKTSLSYVCISFNEISPLICVNRKYELTRMTK